MDLDELKYELNHKLSTDHAGRSDEDIAALLTKRTSSIVDKLKRSLWIEILFGIGVVIAFGYVGICSKYHWLKIYFSVSAVLSAAFVALLIYLLRRTSHLGNTILPVKGNLQTIVNLIEEFVKRYFQFTMALIPICVIFSLFVGYNEPERVLSTEGLAKGHFTRSWQVITFILIYIALLAIGVYYFTRWYLKKLYGNYVDQLKKCIEELREA